MASAEQLAKDWARIPIPQNYSDLYKNFGNPAASDFEAEYIVDTPHFLSSGKQIIIRSHVCTVKPLHDVFARCGNLIHEYDGSFVVRMVRGSDTHLSLHSWGLAIDLNAAAFPLGSMARQDPALIKAFADHGWWYGGDYHHRKDPMHWQRAGDF